MDKSELKVTAIKDGTVIDHIPANDLFKVVRILNLENLDNQITVGVNLDSKKLGKKGIIKISDKFFEDNEINKIALLAPDANLNIIKNYEVVEKRSVQLPDMICGISRCMNPKCITNSEPMITKFEVVSKRPVALKCCYCEKITDAQHIVIE
ncbi:MAG: aspartate carbamoyltransferase regulatory subunit [Bacteroidales bacterium]|nr:aspartate carbamoyltransferase regulatory subunit [Bacteroidales bacterium]